MIYVIDFDDVLFDRSGKFAKACLKIGVDFSGKLYNKAKQGGIYNHEEHLQLIAQSTASTSALQELKQGMTAIFLQCSEFLIPGVVDILKDIKENSKAMILVSKGNKKFQEAKIENSGIAKFFDEIFITDSKLKIFQEKIIPKYKNEKIIFIDDKKAELQEVKNVYPEIEVINKIGGV